MATNLRRSFTLSQEEVISGKGCTKGLPPKKQGEKEG